MTKVLAMLAIGAIASMPRHAMAETEPLPLELSWSAPAGCPGSTFVRRRIEQIVRSPQTAPTRAEATIESGADGDFHLALIVRTGDVEERRTIAAASCSALAEAFAVVVAFMLAPSSDATRSDEPAASEQPSAPPGPTSIGETPPRVAPPSAGRPKNTARARALPPSSPARQLALGLGGSVASGPLPEVSVGLVASAALRLHRFRVGAVGTVSFRQSPRFDQTAGASFDMIDVGAFAGYVVPFGVFGLGPCANIEATYVQLRGFGIRSPWTGSGAWVTAVLGARLEARVVPWLGLFARTDLLVPLGAPIFTLVTRNEGVRLHDASAPAVRLSLGTEFVLP